MTSYSRGADLATLLDGASDKRLSLVTVAVVLAAYEEALDRHSWRATNGCPRAELPALRRLARLPALRCRAPRRRHGTARPGRLSQSPGRHAAVDRPGHLTGSGGGGRQTRASSPKAGMPPARKSLPDGID